MAVSAAAPGPAVLLRALLDTAGTQANHSDSLRGLSAGPAVRRFYGSQPVPVWLTAPDSLSAQAEATIQFLTRVRELGLAPAFYHGPHLQALHDSLRLTSSLHPGQLARAELLLTDAVLQLLTDLRRGRLHPYTVSPIERATGLLFRPEAVLRAALATTDVPGAFRGVQPRHREYQQLQRALAAWLQRPVPPDSAAQWQWRYETAALNLDRWRSEALPDSSYLLINLPAQQLYAVAADSLRARHRVIVGAPATPTPTLSSSIRYFTVAPEWRVPTSIATREMLPRLRHDASYLTRNNLRLYNQQGQPLDPATVNWQQVSARHFPYFIRQAAGCDNALGNIVFRFDNPYSVYLHDTPTRELFWQANRALSHGCVRLEKPFSLAYYLLQADGQHVQLPPEDACARQPVPRNYPLRHPVTLYIRYATCAVENSRLHFYPDIYHRDEMLRHRLFAVGK
ncbi:L,D-transpeptidase scaffold domain-containing protein [Hymenobacter rigui]|uniref:L,D-transpeptidase family protein n=1 Tax=Hymenobacter rigui TaxID=334424 RepID=UPI001476FFAF|nr:L,D-transpeptidase family protein [Hymenobacter rigui]